MGSRLLRDGPAGDGGRLGAVRARLKALEAAGWRLATLREDGTPEPAGLDGLLDRGWWSQVAMLRAGELPS
jgi:hypothetical protein